MTTIQPGRSPASAGEDTSALGPAPSPPGPPTLVTPVGTGDWRPTPGSSPMLGTSCDELPKLVPLTTGQEDGKAVATASQRLQVHWSHGRKRRNSGDSHEVYCPDLYVCLFVCLSLCLPACPPVRLSIYISIYLYLSILSNRSTSN